MRLVTAALTVWAFATYAVLASLPAPGAYDADLARGYSADAPLEGDVARLTPASSAVASSEPARQASALAIPVEDGLAAAEFAAAEPAVAAPAAPVAPTPPPSEPIAASAAGDGVALGVPFVQVVDAGGPITSGPNGGPLDTQGLDLYDCAQFATWEQALAVYLNSGPGDPNGLDPAGTGVPCWSGP